MRKHQSVQVAFQHKKRRRKTSKLTQSYNACTKFLSLLLKRLMVYPLGKRSCHENSIPSEVPLEQRVHHYKFESKTKDFISLLWLSYVQHSFYESWIIRFEIFLSNSQWDLLKNESTYFSLNPFAHCRDSDQVICWLKQKMNQRRGKEGINS